MIIYILLLASNIAISCIGEVCSYISMGHFKYLFGMGTMELIFEVPYTLQIYKRLHKGKDDSNGRDGESG